MVQGDPEAIRDWPVDAEKLRKLLDGLHRFLEQGLGNQLGFHVADFTSPVSIDVMELLGSMGASGVSAETELAWMGLVYYGLFAPLVMPSYISVSVRDAKWSTSSWNASIRSCGTSPPTCRRGSTGWTTTLRGRPPAVVTSVAWAAGTGRCGCGTSCPDR